MLLGEAKWEYAAVVCGHKREVELVSLLQQCLSCRVLACKRQTEGLDRGGVL